MPLSTHPQILHGDSHLALSTDIYLPCSPRGLPTTTTHLHLSRHDFRSPIDCSSFDHPSIAYRGYFACMLRLLCSILPCLTNSQHRYLTLRVLPQFQYASVAGVTNERRRALRLVAGTVLYCMHEYCSRVPHSTPHYETTTEPKLFSFPPARLAAHSPCQIKRNTPLFHNHIRVNNPTTSMSQILHSKNQCSHTSVQYPHPTSYGVQILPLPCRTSPTFPTLPNQPWTISHLRY